MIFGDYHNPWAANLYNNTSCHGVVIPCYTNKHYFTGEDAADDASVADALTMHDAEAQIKLRRQRKWMCVGYNARGEPEGEKIAADADFLISFASPDRDENNRILQELKTGVYYDGSLRLLP